jgi:hypothetical protein
MKKETILSLVLVILILGSIIGMAVGTRPDVDDPVIEDPEDEKELKTYFTNANATVLDTYPELLIVSKTDVFENSVVEGDLLKIEGITRVVVEFDKQEEDFIVIIRAIIDDSKKEEIINSIYDINYFTSDPIEFYKQADLDLNEKVTFTNDENKTLEYDFVDYRVQGIIGIDTLKEDVVSGQIQALFRGEMPETLMFYEISNVTASPEMITENINLEVLEWKEEYLIDVSFNLEDDLNISENIDGNFQVNRDFQGLLEYQIDQNISYDLNYPTIEDFFIDENKISFVLKEIDYNQYTQTLSALEEINLFEENIITRPEIKYSITTTEVENITTEIETLPFLEKNTFKKAIFDISTITIEDVEYTYKEETIDVWLEYPQDLEKTNFDLFFQGYALRDELMFVNLQKIEE